MLVFRVECGRSKLEARAVHAVERVHADNRIGVAVDLAGDDRHDAASGADVELGRPHSEDIARDIGWIGDRNGKFTGGAGSPHAAVFGAEGAGAGARRDLRWLGFPLQLE